MSENIYADSAGLPWDGRAFQPNAWADDDGKANPRLIELIKALHAGEARSDSVVDELRNSRVLVPLLANLGESGVGAHGQTVDKSADLSIVTVETPDGHSGLPVFSSVEAMQRWNPKARPVPTAAVKAALAAASEKNKRLILDPMAETEFVLRGPAIAALAQGFKWVSPEEDERVVAAFAGILDPLELVKGWSLEAGDPLCLLESAELELTLKLPEGLDRETIDVLLQDIATQISKSFDIAEYVDSLRVKLAAA
ncbi:MAG: SseB family protein [Rhodoluna sp.]|nr:SseB family protein [Rhodoluna sp.]